MNRLTQRPPGRRGARRAGAGVAIALLAALVVAIGAVEGAADPPAPAVFQVADDAARGAALPLDGRALSAGAAAYIFLTITDPALAADVDRVELWLDDPERAHPPTQVERVAPYDLRGGSVTAANPLDVASLAGGTHRVNALAHRRHGAAVQAAAGFTVQHPEGDRLLVSTSADRRASAPLQGVTVLAGTALHIQLEPSDPRTERVELWLDDPTRASAPRQVERTAPYDLGGGTVTTAQPVLVEPGEHTVSARRIRKDGTVELSAATITVRRPAQDTLVVADNPSRFSAQRLDGRTLAPGAAYIELAPADGELSRVELWLDDPTMSGPARHTEQARPYDLAGGDVATANPLDLGVLDAGTHTVTARRTTRRGTTTTTAATFRITSTPGPGTFSAPVAGGGGWTELADGSRILVPAGLVPAGAQAHLDLGPITGLPTSPGLTAVRAPFHLTIDGLGGPLPEPILVELELGATAVQDAWFLQRTFARRFDEGTRTWLPLVTTIDGGTVTFVIDHLSTFDVVAEPLDWAAEQFAAGRAELLDRFGAVTEPPACATGGLPVTFTNPAGAETDLAGCGELDATSGRATVKITNRARRTLEVQLPAGADTAARADALHTMLAARVPGQLLLQPSEQLTFSLPLRSTPADLGGNPAARTIVQADGELAVQVPLSVRPTLGSAALDLAHLVNRSLTTTLTGRDLSAIPDGDEVTSALLDTTLRCALTPGVGIDEPPTADGVRALLQAELDCLGGARQAYLDSTDANLRRAVAGTDGADRFAAALTTLSRLPALAESSGLINTLANPNGSRTSTVTWPLRLDPAAVSDVALLELALRLTAPAFFAEVPAAVGPALGHPVIGQACADVAQPVTGWCTTGATTVPGGTAVSLAHLQQQNGLGNPCVGAVVVVATDPLGRFPRRAGSSLADCQPPPAVHAEVDLDTGAIHVSWPPTPGAVAYTVRWMDDAQPNPVLLETTVTAPMFDCTCQPTQRALAFHVTATLPGSATATYTPSPVCAVRPANPVNGQQRFDCGDQPAPPTPPAPTITAIEPAGGGSARVSVLVPAYPHRRMVTISCTAHASTDDAVARNQLPTGVLTLDGGDTATLSVGLAVHGGLTPGVTRISCVADHFAIYGGGTATSEPAGTPLPA